MPPDHLIVPEEMSRRADVALRALSVNSYFLDLGQAVKRAVEIAGASPCQKSKRGATAFARRRMFRNGDPFGQVMTVYTCGHNRPAGSMTCAGTPNCEAACKHLCDHAEAVAVKNWLAEFGDSESGHALFDIVHIELRQDDAGKWVPVPFDREGKPKGPSCISCARYILCADARLVWLWGIDGWRWWYAQDFLRDTLDELKLVDPSLLPRRIGAVST